MKGDEKPDLGLRPDPIGAHDPLQAATADYSLRPDPLGERDPLGHTDRDARESNVVDDGRDAAEKAAVRAASFSEQARREAADLANNAREFVANRVDEARDRTLGALDDARTWVSETQDEQRRRIARLARDSQQRIESGRSQVEEFIDENPLLVGVVGVAAGLLLGALIPRTRGEDRSIGPYADELRAQGLQYAREATHRGRAFVENALDPDNLNAAQAERRPLDRA